jgi:hypothetical protein
MTEGLRFTKAQHEAVARLACDVATRNGWPLTERWWRTPRLLGHEDLSPISRHDSRGGWDPGALREKPFFDWEYVYRRIEEIYRPARTLLSLPDKVIDMLPGVPGWEAELDPWRAVAQANDRHLSAGPDGQEAGAQGEEDEELGQHNAAYQTEGELTSEAWNQESEEDWEEEDEEEEEDEGNTADGELDDDDQQTELEAEERRLRPDETAFLGEWQVIRDAVVRPVLAGSLSSALSRLRTGRAVTNANSSQRDQSNTVLIHVARSVGLAETSLRYDLVHDDSARINFGIGSWTGTRIADVLDTYAAYANKHGLTNRLMATFGGKAGFDGIRNRFRTNGTATTMTAAERAQLRALGRRIDLQPAQDRHLANDIRADLAAIGSTGNPWYPFIDGGMGAISEIAAHVLVHARHQSGGKGLRHRLAAAIAHFGGDVALGQAMTAGTVTERDFLNQVAAEVVAHVRTRYRAGVRNRYARLWTDWGGSDLAFYFNPTS